MTPNRACLDLRALSLLPRPLSIYSPLTLNLTSLSLSLDCTSFGTAGGNLGQGTHLSYASPRQVSRMRGKGITTAACSDGCSAAVR